MIGIIIGLKSAFKGLVIFEPFVLSTFLMVAIFIVTPIIDIYNGDTKAFGVDVMPYCFEGTIIFDLSYLAFCVGYFKKKNIPKLNKTQFATMNEESRQTIVVVILVFYVICYAFALIDQMTHGINWKYILSFGSTGLPQNIICINRTNSKEELAEYYSMADVFLNLSYEETFGLVTLEAMACGTPLIVYDRTAVPEIVDETCGEIVSGNIDELAKKVEIIDKLSKTDACVRKAQEFDYKNCYKKYVQLYEKLCRQGAEIE